MVYFLEINVDGKRNCVTRLVADGSVVSEWNSKNILTDGMLLASSGPGWVEFHGAFDRQPEHGDYFVPYPGKPDVSSAANRAASPERLGSLAGV